MEVQDNTIDKLCILMPTNQKVVRKYLAQAVMEKDKSKYQQKLIFSFEDLLTLIKLDHLK